MSANCRIRSHTLWKNSFPFQGNMGSKKTLEYNQLSSTIIHGGNSILHDR